MDYSALERFEYVHVYGCQFANQPDIFVVANDNHDHGNLTSWRYDTLSDKFTLLDSVLSLGSCAHLAISPDGTHVHIANLYGNGKQGSNAALVSLDGM